MKPIERVNLPIRVRPKKFMAATPCAIELSALFSCWRSLSVDHARCAHASTALVTCMNKFKHSSKSNSAEAKVRNHWLEQLKKGVKP